MQTTSPFYRYSGLIAVLGLLALLVGLIIMVLLPTIRYAAWMMLGLGVLLLAVAFIIDFRRVSGAITGRRGLFSAGATVMASIFIGITLLVNAISIGSYQRFDVTGVSQFTLTSQTKDVLSKLKMPVKALAFTVPGDPYGIGSYAANLLEEYRRYTDQLSIKKIDPDEHPDQARQYGITQYQTIVFESQLGRRTVLPQEIMQIGADQQGNPQILGIEAEHAFTSAILEVTGIVQKKIYFLIGHGEANIDASYSSAKQGLLDTLYKVESLDLLFTDKIPDDAAALIIAGPQKPLSADELNIIQRYLKNGGWVMLLLNPGATQGMDQLLSPWDVRIEDGGIVDPSSSLSNDVKSPIVPRIRNFFGFTTVYFPGATAILPQPEYQPQVIPGSGGDTPLQIVWVSDKSPIEMYSLLRTSQDSWLEKDSNPDSKPAFNEGTDLKGPLNIGFLIAAPLLDASGKPIPNTSPTRLVVVGDSDFAANQHFYNGDNGNFFVQLVELLTGGKELISIERRVLPFRRLVIGPEEANLIRISSIGLLPLLVLIAGAVIWWRRR
ncbi:MAG: GldG family protein [Chloroflexi bacterium]|nr:GldG family protein [Chloroflexota bacterium]